MTSYFVELNDIITETAAKAIFSKIHRGEYIETHAYPDDVAAEADPADDNTFIDTTTNDFDV